MGFFAQPLDAVAGFVPEVCSDGEGSGAEVLKQDGSRRESMPGSEENFAM